MRLQSGWREKKNQIKKKKTPGLNGMEDSILTVEQKGKLVYTFDHVYDFFENLLLTVITFKKTASCFDSFMT